MQSVMPFVQLMYQNYTRVIRMLGHSQPWYSDRYESKEDEQFCEYVISQTNVNEYVEAIRIKYNELQNKIITQVAELEKETDLSICFRIATELRKINGVEIPINKEIKEELAKIREPLERSQSIFSSICFKYKNAKNPSKHLLTNNWKLRKIFNKCPSFKTSVVNPVYVLSPEQVTEIINNYFLYIKCGWNNS